MRRPAVRPGLLGQFSILVCGMPNQKEVVAMGKYENPHPAPTGSLHTRPFKHSQGGRAGKQAGLRRAAEAVPLPASRSIDANNLRIARRVAEPPNGHIIGGRGAALVRLHASKLGEAIPLSVWDS